MAPLPYCEPLTATELSGDKKTTHEAALSWQIAGILSEIPQKSRKIALSHTFVTGAQVTPDSERPLAAGGSSSVALSLYDAFHYTALGHLHAQQRLSDRAFYCGSLMKYSFSEVSQKKGSSSSTWTQQEMSRQPRLYSRPLMSSLSSRGALRTF